MGQRWWAGAVLAAAVSGCGEPATYPVKGQVVWTDGTPARELAGGTVLFDRVTDDDKARVSPRGGIEADGSYRVGTFKTGDGAPKGRYRVAVQPDEKPGRPSPLAVRFQDLKTTDLEVTVEARDNTLELKVERVAPAKGGQ